MSLRPMRLTLIAAALCALTACGSSRSDDDRTPVETGSGGGEVPSVLDNYNAGSHSATVQGATNPVCSRCHSDEGFRAFLGETTGMDADQLSAALEGRAAPAEISSVQCRTCHDGDFGELRVSAGGEAPAGAGQPPFSREFNLCTSCHQAFLTASFDTVSGTYSYTLDRSRRPFHGTALDPSSDTSNRLIWDTHFASAADGIAGYNINAADERACTSCHDPHGATRFAQAGARTIAEAWSASGHADYQGAPFTYAFTDPACLKCHNGTEFVRAAQGSAPADLDLSQGGGAVSCAACHDLQARTAEGTFDLGAVRRIASVTFPSGASASLDEPSNLCMECHQGRSSSPTVDARIAAGNLGFSNIHYYAAAASLFGGEVHGGYEYPGRRYQGRNIFGGHPAFGVPELTTCAGCHMGNELSHTFEVPLAKCTPCHPGASFETLGGSPSINHAQIAALKDQLLGLIRDSGVQVHDSYPYFANITTERQLKAAYNWQVADKEPAGYIHNGIYIRQLLHDSIVDMGGTPPGRRP